MATVNLVVKGKVQGVFFRATAKDMADKIGVKGWVKNTPAGDVELVANGTPKQLEEFIAWCHRGPSRATVAEVVSKELPDTSFDNFSVIR